MKPICKRFVCPKCRKVKMLKINEICLDCRDEQTLYELSKKVASQIPNLS